MVTEELRAPSGGAGWVRMCAVPGGVSTSILRAVVKFTIAPAEFQLEVAGSIIFLIKLANDTLKFTLFEAILMFL